MYAGERVQQDEDERGNDHLANQFPLPTIPSPPGSSISSLSSQDSAAAHVHPPAPDMDDSAEGYRRRRAGLAGDENGRARGLSGPKANARRHRGLDLDGSHDEAGSKYMVYSSEDGHSSDFSSLPTSDDVELEHYPSEGGISDDEGTSLAKNDKQRRKRRRTRAATLKDGSAGSIKIAKQEQKTADKNVIRALIINALLIASWYLFSVSISVVGHMEAFLLCRVLINIQYNRWMFSPGNLDFHFPLFTTCMHMVVQFLLASLVLYFLPHFRPRSDSITNPHNHGRVPKDPSHTDKPLMTKTFYLTRIGPCGAATGLDIGLGNMSLKFITLTFFSMALLTPPNPNIRLIL